MDGGAIVFLERLVSVCYLFTIVLALAQKMGDPKRLGNA
jgi:hypothetical protein